ncbi:MAG TPA: hypothetical protein PKY82_19125 [Pyrinomonadaceae bacterium]|nr:hypothetical protein [Pyrinomonadaceae bacterium]
MAKRYPRNISIFNLSQSLKAYSIDDNVSVKDSAVYQFQQTKYLVRKQNGNFGDSELLMWLDKLANQGWELISFSVNLGFYIFKKAVQ